MKRKVVALMLPSDTFSNVEVSNGKVMDQDGQSIVLGLAFPGLADSLGLKDYEPTEDIELPDYVEVTADAKDFSLDFTATILSSGLFSEIDTDDRTDADDLTDNMDKLTDASSKLVDGTDELASGLSQMQTYMGEYTSGVEALNSGAKALGTALGTLDSNGSKLKEGSVQIKNGLGTLSGALGKVQIPDGSGQVSEAAGGQLNTGMKALASGGNTLAEAMKEFDKEGIQKLGDLAGDDLENVLHNVKAVKKADESYQSFGGIKDGQKGEVKFIIETKEIK